MSEQQPSSPNRWHTTVSVEIYIHDRMRYIKWFSDLQMAYLWVNGHVRTLNEPFDMENNFVRFADRMDQRWTERQDGCTLATNSQYKYRVYYEPGVPFHHEDQQRTDRIENNQSQGLTLQLPNHILYQINQYQNNQQNNRQTNQS